MDLFLIHHQDDQDYSQKLAAGLSDRGLRVGPPVVLWPQIRLLARVDHGLIDARVCVVVVSDSFLKLAWARKALDGLTLRRRVVSLLRDVTEEVVAVHSPRLAVAALPPTPIEPLARLLRGAPGPTG